MLTLQMEAAQKVDGRWSWRLMEKRYSQSSLHHDFIK